MAKYLVLRTVSVVLALCAAGALASALIMFWGIGLAATMAEEQQSWTGELVKFVLLPVLATPLLAATCVLVWKAGTRRRANLDPWAVIPPA